MSLRKFCNQDLVSVPPSLSIIEAARMMDIKNVGCLLVMDEGKLVGILTDRDIVLRVVNMERNPQAMAVKDAMTPEPATLDESLGLAEALEIVKSKAIRRFPVVDRYGKIVGIFTVDDVVSLLGKELGLIGQIIERERALI